MKNTGVVSPSMRGRRVFVRLRNGRRPAESWAVETSRWTLTGHPFDIAEFEFAA